MTPKQKEVYDLIMEGRSNKDISVFLGIEEKTVKYHITEIYKEYNVKSRSQLMAHNTIITNAETFNAVKSTLNDLAKLEEERRNSYRKDLEDMKRSFKTKEDIIQAFDVTMSKMHIMKESNVAMNMKTFLLEALKL